MNYEIKLCCALPISKRLFRQWSSCSVSSNQGCVIWYVSSVVADLWTIVVQVSLDECMNISELLTPFPWTAPIWFIMHVCDSCLFTGDHLRVCIQGVTCCTPDMEVKLQKSSRQEFDEIMAEKINLLRQTYISRTAKFDGRCIYSLKSTTGIFSGLIFLIGFFWDSCGIYFTLLRSVFLPSLITFMFLQTDRFFQTWLDQVWIDAEWM